MIGPGETIGPKILAFDRAIGPEILAFRNASRLDSVGTNLLTFRNASLFGTVGTNLLVLNHAILRPFCVGGPLRHALGANLLVLDVRSLRSLVLSSSKALHAVHALSTTAPLYVGRLTLRGTALDGLSTLCTGTACMGRGDSLAILLIAGVAAAGSGSSRRRNRQRGDARREE